MRLFETALYPSGTVVTYVAVVTGGSGKAANDSRTALL